LSAIDDNNTRQEEKVSDNAKLVLIALFILVGGVIVMYAFTVVYKLEVSEQLNAVFIAAVTGCFALGGTLIQSLWGK